MKQVLIIAALVLVAWYSNAQGYKQAAGIRASWISPGFEYRYYTSDMHSLRGLLALRDRGLQFHALSEFYQYDLFSFSNQILFFYGAGLHGGFENWDEVTEVGWRKQIETHTSWVAGIDGLIGVEYVFYDAPVKLGLEAKPFMDVFSHDGIRFNLYDFAFTFKYLF
ncbi:MAG: hypothetical protein WCY58_04635 [Mariniphaga sp.]|nr:hypothetical protein [Mariniphaga sp.]MDD4225878.1 hypothetical protein [Mariniphaga sp.]MDD4425557.1 hypothetical protein [Mariniphaga sp.]